MGGSRLWCEVCGYVTQEYIDDPCPHTDCYMAGEPMTYDHDIWQMAHDRIWVLKQAATHAGFLPHAETTAKFLKTMELEGLVRQSDTAPVWFITDAGRTELATLSDQQSGSFNGRK